MDKQTFIELLTKYATKEPSLYVMGGFGQKLTPYWKDYFIKSYGFNRTIDSYGHDRKALIMAASEDTYAFDCNCYIKSILNIKDGELGYRTSPCPDVSIAAMLRSCKNVRQISNSVLPNPGDYLTFKDYSHCGIYLGNGLVAEATYSGKDGAQLRNYAGRGWAFAGSLPYIEEAPQPAPVTTVHAVQVMANKTLSAAKKYLRKDQSIFHVGEWYKNAYTFPTTKECEKALPGIQKKYPDAYITTYKSDELVKL